jgi:putative transferase (TIGR04331 family)
MRISNKNIRATALDEFWGEEYPESIYLWYGAQHNGTLFDIEENKTPTLKDPFSTQIEIENGHEFCKKFYYRVLDKLSLILNQIHNLNLPVSFWQVAFGYWLYRHISVVYDKYVCLSALDIDATSIKLLSKADFYIPQNHIDYIFCFANDHGVQQLVSQYYYLFKTKDFAVANKTFTHGEVSPNTDSMLLRLKRKLSMLKAEPKIALLGVYYCESAMGILEKMSHGNIGNIFLPIVKKSILNSDFKKRELIAGGASGDKFENYFMQTLYYCMPKDFLENFKEYYEAFQRDVQSRKFTHVVAESWITSIPNGIYIGVAKLNHKQFISQEHGGSRMYYKNGMQFIDFDVADIFLSTGSESNDVGFIRGGLTCKDIVPYRFDIKNEFVLYLTTTKFIYWQETNEYGATNSTFIRELKMVSDFINLCPPFLKRKILFRERKIQSLWNVGRFLEIDKNNIKTDKNSFTHSILKSKIVIIDHMSTGFAEILLMKAPFILLYNVNLIPFSNNLRNIFNALVRCGVVHVSSKSAVSHLETIYNDVEGWWQSEAVQKSVNQLTVCSVAPASKTTDYLLSLLSEEISSRDILQYRFWVLTEFCARWVYRLMKKIKSVFPSSAQS